jgi:hypothetical protein
MLFSFCFLQSCAEGVCFTACVSAAAGEAMSFAKMIASDKNDNIAC